MKGVSPILGQPFMVSTQGKILGEVPPSPFAVAAGVSDTATVHRRAGDSAGTGRAWVGATLAAKTVSNRLRPAILNGCRYRRLTRGSFGDISRGRSPVRGTPSMSWPREIPA